MKNSNFAFYLNPCCYCLDRPFDDRERYQILFLGVFCIKRNFNKISNVWPKPWTANFMVFETDVFIVQKILFSIIVFSRFIFTIYYIGIQVVTGVTRGYIVL